MYKKYVLSGLAFAVLIASGSVAEARIVKDVEVRDNAKVSKSELQGIYSSIVGKSDSHSNLEELKHHIKSYYNGQGYFLTSVSIPDHAHPGGKLKINVKEGSIRKVEVLSDAKGTTHLLQTYIEKIEDMHPVRMEDLQRYINLIKKIPGYQVKYEIKKISTTAADLILKIDVQNGKGFIDFNDQGNSRTGKYNGSMFLQFMNPTGNNDSIILNIGSTNKPKSMLSLTAGYLIRLNSYGTSLSFLVSDMKNNPYKYAAETSKDDKSMTYKVQLAHYLILDDTTKLKAEFGADWLDSKLHTFSAKTKDYITKAGFVGLKLTHNDEMGGHNTAEVYYTHSIGKAKFKVWTDAEKRFDKKYDLVRYSLKHSQEADNGFGFEVLVNGQISNEKLPSERQFFIGGAANGRGYKSGLIAVDQGVSFGVEPSYNFLVEDSFL